MPHVSKHILKEPMRQKLETRLASLLAETGTQRAVTFRELLTATEQLMLAKRLTMIFLISKGMPTHKISGALRVSPSTVARFEVGFDFGKYKNVAKWLKTKNRGEKLLELLLNVAAVPFKAQHKSLSRLLYESEHTIR